MTLKFTPQISDLIISSCLETEIIVLLMLIILKKFCGTNQVFNLSGGQRSKFTVIKFLAIMQEFLCYFVFVLYLFWTFPVFLTLLSLCFLFRGLLVTKAKTVVRDKTDRRYWITLGEEDEHVPDVHVNVVFLQQSTKCSVSE